jgi:hypothetical protein
MEQPPPFQEKSGFPAWIFTTIAGIAVSLFLYQRFAYPSDVEPFDWVGLVVLALVGLLIFAFKLTVIIDNQGISFKYPPIYNKSKCIPWDQIKSIEVMKINPLKEFGGWGIRYGRLGASFTTRGRHILHIKKTEGKPINLTIISPATLIEIASKQNWPVPIQMSPEEKPNQPL